MKAFIIKTMNTDENSNQNSKIQLFSPKQATMLDRFERLWMLKILKSEKDIDFTKCKYKNVYFYIEK